MRREELGHNEQTASSNTTAVHSGTSLKDRAPGIDFLRKVLKSRGRKIDLSKTRFDRDKLDQLISLYDKACTQSKPPTIPAFMKSAEAMQIYSSFSLPTKDKLPGRTSIRRAVLLNEIPIDLLAPEGSKRSLAELRKDPVVVDLLRSKRSARKRAKKQQKAIATDPIPSAADPMGSSRSSDPITACELERDENKQRLARFKQIKMNPCISWHNARFLGERLSTNRPLYNLKLLILINSVWKYWWCRAVAMIRFWFHL